MTGADGPSTLLRTMQPGISIETGRESLKRCGAMRAGQTRAAGAAAGGGWAESMREGVAHLLQG